MILDIKTFVIFFTLRFLKKIKKVFGADLREFFFHTCEKIPKKMKYTRGVGISKVRFDLCNSM
jgi:hypothetical protein|tara:strand:+ start:1563 stop:1751 length:189 start_codon:yes stop_codon:yes gene_type:complete